MKIFYMNDETTDVTVRTIDMFGTNENTVLPARHAKVFAFQSPPNAIAFVKRWDNNTVLLSYTVNLPQEYDVSDDKP